jgi:hypothetical protein
VALVDDVGEQVAVGDDDVAGVESGADHLGDELGAAGHEEQGFARQAHLPAAVEEQVADDIANGGAAGVGTLGDGVTAGAQPLREQPALRRFAGAVEAVQGEEKAALHT